MFAISLGWSAKTSSLVARWRTLGAQPWHCCWPQWPFRYEKELSLHLQQIAVMSTATAHQENLQLFDADAGWGLSSCGHNKRHQQPKSFYSKVAPCRPHIFEGIDGWAQFWGEMAPHLHIRPSRSYKPTLYQSLCIKTSGWKIPSCVCDWLHIYNEPLWFTTT